MTGLYEITIEEQIACVDRELGVRHLLYPLLVKANKMTQAKADKQIELMKAVSETLREVQRERDDGR